MMESKLLSLHRKEVKIFGFILIVFMLFLISNDLFQWKERIEQFLPEARVGKIQQKKVDIKK